MMGKTLMTQNSNITIEQHIFSQYVFNNPFDGKMLLIIALTFTSIFIGLKELSII